MKRLLGAITIAVLAVMGTAHAASAHPLGNFTINQFTAVRVQASAVTIDMVTDEAEIPTFQVRGDIDLNHDNIVDDGEAATWRQAQCATAAQQTALAVDGRAISVRAEPGGSLSFPVGQAGLMTLRLECQLRADIPAAVGEHTLTYRNAAFDGRLGWHEVIATSEGDALLSSDVPTVSVTDRLQHYPTEQLRSPLNQRAATVRFRSTGAAAAATGAAASSGQTPNAARAAAATALLPRGVDRATRAFTNLVARRHLTVAFGAIAVALAIALGSLHALAPGHGKTVMAAYIVGQRGSLRQAAVIGLTVTATHTAGVVVLGILLTTSSILAPERLYPWLGVASGVLLAGIGITLARRALRYRRAQVRVTTPVASAVTVQRRVLVGARVGSGDHADHDHADHDHADHDHADHDHDHDRRRSVVSRRGERPAVQSGAAHSHGGWSHSHAAVDPALGWRSMMAVGFAGGLVPSPSALLVLLGAITLGRTWFGLLLVTAYGVGMAAMLTAAGLLLVRARGFLDRRADRGQRAPGLAFVARMLPLATSGIIVTVGLVLAARSFGKL